jgi:hypothetical protein
MRIRRTTKQRNFPRVAGAKQGKTAVLAGESEPGVVLTGARVRGDAGSRIARTLRKSVSGNRRSRRKKFYFVVDAKARTQSFQALALGAPLLRGRRSGSLHNWIAASKAGIQRPKTATTALAPGVFDPIPRIQLSCLSLVVLAKAGIQVFQTTALGSRLHERETLPPQPKQYAPLRATEAKRRRGGRPD